MESLQVFEAIELIRINESAMRELFEVWLSITFATIVASFAGREQLTKVMRRLGGCLYVLATFTMVSAWINYADSNFQLAAVLATKGAVQAVPWITGTGYISLVALGVVTTLYFIFYGSNNGDA
jgi:hypothetical protein